MELRVIVDETGEPVGMRLAKLRDERGHSLAQINEPDAQRMDREPSFAREVREQLGESSEVAIAFYEGEPSPRSSARPASGSQSLRSALPTGAAATDSSLGDNGKQIAALAFAEEITARGDSMLADIDAALNAVTPPRSAGGLSPTTSASEEEDVPCQDQRDAVNRDRRHLVQVTAAAIFSVVAIALNPLLAVSAFAYAIGGGLSAQAFIAADLNDSMNALKRCMEP